MNNATRLFVCTVVLQLAGCSRDDTADTRPLQNAVGGPTAETVNGQPVPQALLESVARARDLDLTKPEQRSQALNLLTDYVLLAQAARENNYYADQRFRADAEAARLQGIANVTLERLQQLSPVTDAQVRAEYDAQVARAGKFVYDFSQLLFDNEADALAANGEIAAKSFAAVYEAWRARAKQANVFTRVRKDQIPEELARALDTLHNDESSRVPIKTAFGWHVVHRDNASPFVPQPFEQVKDGVRQGLLLASGRERLQKLKDGARIDYPPGVAPPKTDAKPSSAPIR